MFGLKSLRLRMTNYILHGKIKNNLKGRILVNPHTSYYSEEALYESRSKACKTCLDIINGVSINNRIV